jgi:hypothetical protein
MKEQGLGLRLSYPLRVITLGTSISHKPSSFSTSSAHTFKWTTQVNLNAGKYPNRNLMGVVKWNLDDASKGGSSKVMQLQIELKHPTLLKVYNMNKMYDFLMEVEPGRN